MVNKIFNLFASRENKSSKITEKVVTVKISSVKLTESGHPQKKVPAKINSAKDNSAKKGTESVDILELLCIIEGFVRATGFPLGIRLVVKLAFFATSNVFLTKKLHNSKK